MASHFCTCWEAAGWLGQLPNCRSGAGHATGRKELSLSAARSKEGLRKQAVVQAWETKADDQEPARYRNREEGRSEDLGR